VYLFPWALLSVSLVGFAVVSQIKPLIVATFVIVCMGWLGWFLWLAGEWWNF
jgi:hypothetical protein